MNEEIFIERSMQSLRNLDIAERTVVWLVAIMSPEAVSKKVACKLLMPDDIRLFDFMVNNLQMMGWLKSICGTLSCDTQVAEMALELDKEEYNQDIAQMILEEMMKHLVPSPYEDIMERREYFLVARVFLTYLYDNEKVDIQDKSYYSFLFALVSTLFARNSELSFYGNNRQPVRTLEERIDFRLLQYAIYVDNKSVMADAYRLLGDLYTKNFRYKEAKQCFNASVNIYGYTSEIYLSYARMYNEYGDMGAAMMHAYKAYCNFKFRGELWQTIDTCLFVAYVCAVHDSPVNSHIWKNNALEECKDGPVPDGHPFKIRIKMIDALMKEDDSRSALRLADSAELDIYRLYGYNAPDMANIAYIRNVIYTRVGQSRRSQEEYGKYVEVNHYNYGYSDGDTAIQLAGTAYENLLRGNLNTGIDLCNMSNNIMGNEQIFAATVKFENAYTTFEAFMVEGNIEGAKDSIDYAEKVYENEILPNNLECMEIKDMFCNKVIPDSIMGMEYLRLISHAKVDIFLQEGRMDDAKALIQEMAEKESVPKHKLNWKIHLGRVFCEEGKNNEGLQVWKDTIDEADDKNKFFCLKEVAQWAVYYEMMADSLTFFGNALEPDVMDKGKTSEIVECLNSYADVLNNYGVKADIEEMWNNALMLMKSMDDNDGIALLYFQLAQVKQDKEAEILIKKAIEFWKPENELFDETLAKMYWELYEVLKMKGKYEEANEALENMKRLCSHDVEECIMDD